MSFEPILLAPEESVEEIYPYRRVWRTSWIEISTLFIAVTSLFVLGLIGVFPAFLNGGVFRAAFAVLPVVSWLIFSYWGEQRALLPRPYLGGMMLLGALVASGVAVPLETEVFTLERWLPHNGFFGR